jgi:amylosucrase
MIEQAGYNSFAHRKYLKDYYSGAHPDSPAVGELFSSNPKTGDARISGSLASLCGLEKAIAENNKAAIDLSIQKILMMQAHSFFLGGVPMLFYGDEVGYTNDYSYLKDEGKSYDNRWMHRPIIDWNKNKKAQEKGTVEEIIFSATKKLLQIRGELPVVADRSNIIWLTPHNVHVAAYIRHINEQRLFCVFNFSNEAAFLTWYAFKEKGNTPATLIDHWSGNTYQVGNDDEFFVLPAYGFALLEG